MSMGKKEGEISKAGIENLLCIGPRAFYTWGRIVCAGPTQNCFALCNNLRTTNMENETWVWHPK
jgi:hypothetical protein